MFRFESGGLGAVAVAADVEGVGIKTVDVELQVQPHAALPALVAAGAVQGVIDLPGQVEPRPVAGQDFADQLGGVRIEALQLRELRLEGLENRVDRGRVEFGQRVGEGGAGDAIHADDLLDAGAEAQIVDGAQRPHGRLERR